MKIHPPIGDPAGHFCGAFDSAVSRWMLPVVLGALPLVFVPGIDDFTALPRLILLQVLLIAILPLLLWRKSFVRSPSLLPAFVLLLLMALSAFSALNPVSSVLLLSRHATLFLLLWSLIQYFRREHLITLCLAVTLGGLLVTLIGLAEYLGFVVSWIPTTGRPSSTLGFRNLAAEYLIGAIPFAGVLAIAGRRPKIRALSVATVVLMLVALLHTRTRGAWVGFAAAGGLSAAFWVACSGRGSLSQLWAAYGKARILIPAGICLLLILLAGSMTPRFQEAHVQRLDEKKTELSVAVTGILKQGWDRGRFTLWNRSMSMVFDHPVRGVGLGNWGILYPRYARGSFLVGTVSPRHPHSDPIWIWAELGTPGLLAYLWLMVTALTQAWRIWREGRAPEDNWMAFCFVFSIFAVAGHGMFSFPWDRVVPVTLSFAGLAGLNALSGGSRWCRDVLAARLTAGLGLLVVAGGLLISIQKVRFDYHYVRAIVASRQKNFAAQAREAALALENGPLHGQAFTLLSDGLIGLERYEEARAVARRGLRYHPYFVNSLNSMGLAWDREGNLDKALEYYRKAAEIAPRHTVAQYNLGTAYQRKGELDSAVAAYSRVAGGDFTKPYVNLATIYAERGQWDSVLAVSDRAVHGQIPSYLGYVHLGRAFARAGKLDEAVDAYESFLRLNEDATAEMVRGAEEELADLYSARGVRAEQRSLPGQSLKDYEKAVGLEPDDPIHHFNLGNAFRRSERIDEAIASYGRALELDSTMVGALHNLAITYYERSMLREAEKAFARALRHAGGPAEAALIWNQAAATYAGLGNRPMAIRAYGHVVDDWEGDPEAIRSAGDNLLALGDTTTAIRAYERFIASEGLDQIGAANVRLKLRQLKD